jgi:hypothetical protein
MAHRPLLRWSAGVLALGCALLGLVIAWHYPLAQPLMVGCFVVFLALCYRWPDSWLVLAPAMLPLIGWAPWTGWLTLEEFDLLLLAIAAAGYARIAVVGVQAESRQSTAKRHASPSGLSLSVPVLLLVVLFAGSVTLSALRGFGDAGGFDFGWFQGYHEPMNSLRLAKSYVWALLLLPLWWLAYKRDPERAQDRFSLGLTLSLGFAALATVWERQAFTGLMNFSSDYRTTGPFWEMHVGGAALDGFLALTVPFAVREVLVARSRPRGALAVIVCALAGYACLTTFSRGVYLGVPVGLGVFFVLRAFRSQSVAEGGEPGLRGHRLAALFPAVALIAGFGLLARWMFYDSGYRGATALLGAAALMLPLAGVHRQLPLNQKVTGHIAGLFFAVAACAMAWLLPKGAYVAYGLALVLTAATVWAFRRRVFAAHLAGPLALSGFTALLVATVLVSVQWGDAPAFAAAASAAAACFLLLMVSSMTVRPPWPDAMRWQGGMVCAMGLLVVTIGVFGGGSYMGDRFSTGGRDFEGRLAHWALGTSMLQSPSDLWLGRGLGRFPANYFLIGDLQDHPGDYRIGHEGNNNYLKLTGGLHVDDGWGQVLRVTQRINEPGMPVTGSARIRAAADTSVLFELCEKHLLYPGNCLAKEVSVKGRPGQWQTVDAQLQGAPVSRGAWYVPKLLAYSVAAGTRGVTVELDELRLAGPDGRNLLVNGDFSEGMAHWFFSSDRHHLPWHIKNMMMNVLFDQGIVGLAIWGALMAGALVKLVVGRGKLHSLSPVLAASLVGFMVVGLFDSLLDVPRVAALFYFLLLVSLTLKVSRQRDATPSMTTAQPGTRVAGPSTNQSAVSASRYSRAWVWGAFSFAAILLVVGGLGAFWVATSSVDVLHATPGELVRQAKERLGEHVLAGKLLLPTLDRLQVSIERPPPVEQLPTLGKGQQDQALPAQRFGPTGEPLPMGKSALSDTDGKADRMVVNSAEQLLHAMEEAQAGAVIEVQAGLYRINQALTTRHGGLPGMPIVLRAAKPGLVWIEFNTEQGFHVTQPYWVFENLNIRGVCPRDADCEHAFHVVGEAKGVVLRNNRIEDFNAQIKVNGQDGRWPDFGLAQFNTLTNRHPRETVKSVTPFDLVGANGWRVADNLITDFVHVGGNAVSYGVFMKGASAQGRIERNVIICTSKQISQPGNRIGLSWGGGGSETAYCRDKLCLSEHVGGMASNNVVAHCNDAGIDVNRSRQIAIAHNTLINTGGINARGQSGDVNVYGNLLEGRIRAQTGASLTQGANEVASLNKLLVDADRLRLDRKSAGSANMAASYQVGTDFCEHPRQAMTWSGASVPGSLPCAVGGK